MKKLLIALAGVEVLAAVTVFGLPRMTPSALSAVVSATDGKHSYVRGDDIRARRHIVFGK